MVWECIASKQQLLVNSIDHTGRHFEETWDYEPGKYSSNHDRNIAHHIVEYGGLPDGDVRIRRCTVDHFRNTINAVYPGGIIRALGAGIRDDSSLVYLGKLWRSPGLKRRRLEQYFFNDDLPSGFESEVVSSPTWPLNHPPILDERLVAHMRELLTLKPGLEASLNACLQHLTIPGPMYAGNPDDGIVFAIPQR